MNKNNFSNFTSAKEGDRVWSIQQGWGTIDTIANSGPYSLVVDFDNGASESYDLQGRFVVDDVFSSLFWDVPTFTVPAPPAAPAEHAIECFLNVYPTGEIYWHSSEEEAIAGGGGTGGLTTKALLTFTLPGNFIHKPFSLDWAL